MAIPHLRVNHLSRGKGRSAVQKSAYISRETLYDERLGREWSEWEQREDLLYREIRLPGNAPAWMGNRERLWNVVEACEKRIDARVAWDMDVALPKELTDTQNVHLMQGFLDEQFVARGMVVDWAMHGKDGNPHAHMMVAPRAVDANGPNGFAAAKDKELNRKATLVIWREAWERHVNKALADAGSEERIDMRSYERQGLPKLPTRHLGARDSWNERSGIRTRRGDYNRAVRRLNAMTEPIDTRAVIATVQDPKLRARLESFANAVEARQAQEQAAPASNVTRLRPALNPGLRSQFSGSFTGGDTGQLRAPLTPSRDGTMRGNYLERAEMTPVLAHQAARQAEMARAEEAQYNKLAEAFKKSREGGIER